eukprot:scaffold1211_cov120-Isochrysis_galbana.AAC.3
MRRVLRVLTRRAAVASRASVISSQGPGARWSWRRRARAEMARPGTATAESPVARPAAMDDGSPGGYTHTHIHTMYALCAPGPCAILHLHLHPCAMLPRGLARWP